MELTFVHQYAGDVPKRRRLAKACESCRARKKRCVHFPDNGPEIDGPDGLSNGQSTVEAGEATPEQVNKGSNNEQASSSGSRKHFISDLKPEALFLTRPKPNKRASQSGDDIGVWIDRREWDSLVRHRDAATQKGGSGRQKPHPSIISPLIDLYFDKIHPIIPLLEEQQFRQEHEQGKACDPLIQAMCLVVAKDSAAQPYLQTISSSAPLPAKEFCSRMHDSVRASLRSPCRLDKVTLIRILALLSMHHEGSDGAEDASLSLSQALHHAQTIGIHLGQHAESVNQQEVAMKRLFWCLWSLDRFNGSVNGRPLVMADIDIAIAPIEPGETSFPAFEAWLRITELLNKVISFYRPNVPLDVTGWEDIFPDLEQILDSCKAWNLPRSTLATLHLYYLCVAILSHRCHGIKQIHRGTHSSNRQRLCAGEVVRFMQSEHCKDVHALPIVPYAVSLALSVSYQHLRQSQLAHQQADAHHDFRACTQILQSLRGIWGSVETIYNLARRVLDELDRAPDLAVFRLARTGLDPSSAPAAVSTMSSDIAPTTVISATSTAMLAGAASDPIAAVPVAETHPGDEVIGPPTACSGMHNIHQKELDRRAHIRRAEIESEAQTQLLLEHQRREAELQRQKLTMDLDLFNGMDDIFGTYLDPNYPVHLEDLSFLDDLPRMDWSTSDTIA